MKMKIKTKTLVTLFLYFLLGGAMHAGDIHVTNGSWWAIFFVVLAIEGAQNWRYKDGS